MVKKSIGKNLDVSGVQDQAVFALAMVGATEKAPHADRGSRWQTTSDSRKRLAAGHDRNPAARFSGNTGFRLSGVMLQKKAADRNSGRRDAGFTGSSQLAGDHQTIISGWRGQVLKAKG